jgi:hypothetical protein
MRIVASRRPKRIAFAALTLSIVPLLVAHASAQPGFTVSFGRAFGSIAEAGALADTRQTTVGGVEVEQMLAAERLRLYYELDAGTFATPGDWHYYLHDTGATWKTTFGPKQRHALFVGGSGSVRTNGLSWAAADYHALAGFANLELHPSTRAVVRLGYRVDARTFPDLAEMNQVQHDGFGSLLVNLPTRTTLIGEVHVGAKSYADTLTATVPVDASTPALEDVGAGRMGRGMGPSLRQAAANLPESTVEHNHAGMVNWMIRFAQSLSDRTGAVFQYYQRLTFGRVAPLVVTTPALYFDDGVYDDPFASNARVVSASLKHLFAGGMVLEGRASRMAKPYNSLLALGPDGVATAELDLRQDQVWRTSVEWTVPVFPSRTGPVGIDLDVGYFFTRHRSNDAFYNYTSHNVGVGVTVSY